MDGLSFLDPLRVFYDTETQGYCYSLDAQTGEFDYVHSEITGLALSLLIRGTDHGGGLCGPSCRDNGLPLLHDPAVPSPSMSAEEDLARGTARFLLDAQVPGGGFRHSTRRHRAFPERAHEVHVFDTAICAIALLDFADSRNDGPARQAAEYATDWLTAEAQDPEGWFRAAWFTDSREWGDSQRTGFWSAAGGCFHGKVLSLLPRFNRWKEAERLLNWLLRTQRPDGTWPASRTQPLVHTHGLCYALEGLLHFHWTTGDPPSLKAVKKGIDWLARQAIQYDGIPAWLPSAGPEFRSDAQLQFLRLLRGMDASNEGDLELQPAVAACRRRLEFLRAGESQWRMVGNGSPSAARIAAWPTLFHLADQLNTTSALERLI